MIAFRTLSNASYLNLSFSIIKDTEEYEALPYNDLDSLITIAYGFNLEQVSQFRSATYYALGFTASATTYSLHKNKGGS